MLRKIIIIAMLIVLIAVLTGCNATIIDTNFTYNYGYIKMPNGEVIEGKVEKWCDYEGEQLQVVIGDKTYLTSSFNCVLVKQ